MSRLSDALVEAVTRVVRHEPPAENTSLTTSKRGAYVISFSKGCAFFKRLYQCPVDSDTIWGRLKRAGLIKDAFLVSGFKELEGGKSVLIGKEGTWELTEWMVVVWPDGVVEYSPQRVVLEGILSGYLPVEGGE